MRVIAGIAKSLPLKTPQGMETRPTTDRIKETLFNIIQNYLADAVFLDLFSGSGGIGIEALSRGCRKCYFVDNDAKAVECIKSNVHFTKMEEKSVILKQDVFGSLNTFSFPPVEVVFMDPPYHCGLEKKVLETLRDKAYISEETLIIVEAALDTRFDYLRDIGYEVLKEKRYKTNQHIFLQKKA